MYWICTVIYTWVWMWFVHLNEILKPVTEMPNNCLFSDVDWEMAKVGQIREKFVFLKKYLAGNTSKCSYFITCMINCLK